MTKKMNFQIVFGYLNMGEVCLCIMLRISPINQKISKLIKLPSKLSRRPSKPNILFEINLTMMISILNH